MSHGFCRIHDAQTHEVHETTYRNGNERDDCFALPVMIDDRTVLECVRCGRAFGIFVRRHHCRLCGNVFCDGCTQQRAYLPQHFYSSQAAASRSILPNTVTSTTSSNNSSNTTNDNSNTSTTNTTNTNTNSVL